MIVQITIDEAMDMLRAAKPGEALNTVDEIRSLYREDDAEEVLGWLEENAILKDAKAEGEIFISA